MGQLLGATFPVITARVGEGGQMRGIEVKRIQQLLWLAGFTNVGTADGSWGKNTRIALLDFQEKLGVGPVNAYIEAHDPYDRLFALALMAGVLIALPAGLRSSSATDCFFSYCTSSGFKYGWQKDGQVYNGGTRQVWGFEGRSGWAIVTNPGGRSTAQFRTSGVVVSLNCTSFANLMLSAWVQGNAHASPYDSSQMVGGYDPLGLRYGLQPVSGSYVLDGGMFTDVATLEQMLEPGRVYHLAICYADTGFMKHDTVLYDGYVYECNVDREPAVYRTRLADKIKRLPKNRAVKVFGPGPF